MEGVDQISQLPQPILEHILSFLVVKEAARTSILSKVWNNAWTSLSCLDFGDVCFHQSDILDQILAKRQKHNICIQRFKVTLPYHLSNNRYVGDCVKILVTCNIKELVLEFLRPFNHCTKFIALDLLSVQGHGLNFSSLRELHLRGSFLDEQFLQALCASCNNLEALSFLHCDGRFSLQAARTLPKLRTLRLEYFKSHIQTVDIVAPNLEHLAIRYGNLNVVKIAACKTLKHLELGYVNVTEQWLQSLFSDLPNLEILDIDRLDSLRTITISSDRLKCLRVTRCFNLTVVDLDTPNLLKFSSVDHCSGLIFPSDVDPLRTFKLEAPHLLNVYLDLRSGSFNTDWYSKLTKSLGNFSHSKAVTLGCSYGKGIVIPKDMRQNLLPPLYGTNHLKVIIHHERKYSVVDLLDSLLWISPQLNTLSLQLLRDFKKTVKFTYRDDAGEVEKPCCASLPWKCWRHELKKVTLMDFTGEELQDVRDYFLTNTNILEIIVEPPQCSLRD